MRRLRVYGRIARVLLVVALGLSMAAYGLVLMLRQVSGAQLQASLPPNMQAGHANS